MAGTSFPSGMALTPELVALSRRTVEDSGPDPRWQPADDSYLDGLAEGLARELGDDDLWVFAYGSLIWKPSFSHVEKRVGMLRGWHRSFCMEVTRWRGSPDQPGLMMALERGGSCRGLAFRLPREPRHEEVRKLVRREVSTIETFEVIRWCKVETPDGPVRALVCWAGPSGEGIYSRMPLPEVARILARACGHIGSGAEYLHNTVAHLVEMGIRDRNLWRLQALVAAEIMALHGFTDA